MKKFKHLQTFENYTPTSKYDTLVDYDKNPMLRSYLETALFADLPEEFTEEFGTEDIDVDSVIEAYQDIEKFKEMAKPYLDQLYLDTEMLGMIGGDLWYERQGHGVGFFDRKEIYGVDIADELHNIARTFGSKTIYVSHGIVYIE